MRIIGGKFKGKIIKIPSISRPTTHRVREALFDVILHRFFISLETAFILDAFAGSGAFGLEALSRGALWVDFCEKNRSAANIIFNNIKALNLAPQSSIFNQDLFSVPYNGKNYDVIFCDPPYGERTLIRCSEFLCQQGWIKPQTLVCMESHKTDCLDSIPFLNLLDKRSYGDIVLTFWKL